jgi:hypothetical protein
MLYAYTELYVLQNAICMYLSTALRVFKNCWIEPTGNMAKKNVELNGPFLDRLFECITKLLD